MKKLLFSFIASILVFFTVIFSVSAVSQKTDDKYKVALITDFGDVDDNSFNQQIYEGSKYWCAQNNIPFNYYRPTANSSADRSKAVEIAIERGSNIIFLPGYTYGNIIAEFSSRFEKVLFIGIDIYPTDVPADFVPGNNFVCFTYHEEIAGYLAGYAATKEGYRHHGFLGGMPGMAVTKFGYGYAQGMNDAAKDLGLTEPLEYKFVYGGQFYGDSEITKYIDNWYKSGTEVVFSCGGSIYTSVALAAKDNNKKIIGVDADQSILIDRDYGPGLCVTSAMKGISQTCVDYLETLKNGKDIEDSFVRLGLVSSEDLKQNYVGLPIDTWSMKNFSVDQYRLLVKELLNGTRSVSDKIDTKPVLDLVNLIDLGSVK